jgi:long-chain acyl-CoA synthetase
VTATLLFGEATPEPDEFERRVARGAGGLDALGIGDGDVVALLLPNSPDFVEAMFAARTLGAYYCPINWHFKADEAAFVVRDSGAKALVASPDLIEAVRSALPGIPVITDWKSWRDGQAPYAGPARAPRGNMPYTSGTTGRPKGVRRAAMNDAERRRAAESYLIALGIGPGMRGLVSAPLYHSAPNSYTLFAMQFAQQLVLEARFDAERTLALVERHRLDNLYLVPTMFVRLLNLPPDVRARYDLSSVRFVASTGSPCPPDVKRRMIEWWGPVFSESYASSEHGWVTLIDSHESLARPGCAGKPIGDTRIEILDEAGNPLPRGAVGMIYARQPAFADFTYNNNPEARAAMEKRGLWCVGDMGYLDDEGYLYVTDRKADMVISGGVNIYPAEIEAVLAAMPGVADCAVFGIPDEEFGESLCAAVQPVAGAALTADAVRAFIRERIAGYKVPRQVAFHASLPREESGKIFKRKLREPYWAAAGRKI